MPFQLQEWGAAGGRPATQPLPTPSPGEATHPEVLQGHEGGMWYPQWLLLDSAEYWEAENSPDAGLQPHLLGEFQP